MILLTGSAGMIIMGYDVDDELLVLRLFLTCHLLLLLLVLLLVV